MAYLEHENGLKILDHRGNVDRVGGCHALYVARSPTTASRKCPRPQVAVVDCQYQLDRFDCLLAVRSDEDDLIPG
jgi:hypothetical protein